MDKMETFESCLPLCKDLDVMAYISKKAELMRICGVSLEEELEYVTNKLVKQLEEGYKVREPIELRR